MNLYLIERKEGTCGYDEFDAQVVRAHNGGQARSLCYHADEGSAIWLDSSTSCHMLAHNVQGPAEVVLASFNAG